MHITTRVLLLGSETPSALIHQLRARVAGTAWAIEQLGGLLAVYERLGQAPAALTVVYLSGEPLSHEAEALVGAINARTFLLLVSARPSPDLRAQAAALGVPAVLEPPDLDGPWLDALLDAVWQAHQARGAAHRLAQQLAPLQPLDTMFAHHADGILIVDVEGRVELVNPAAVAILGRAAAEIVGHLVGLPVVVGESTEVEIVRDDQLVIAEMRAAASTWAGRPAVIISLRDCTERYHSAQRLREAEAFSRAIFNSLDDQVCVIGEDGTILTANDAWRAAGAGGDVDPAHIGAGANYFAVCEAAVGSPEAADAQAALAGLRAVLRGDLPAFECEYPCASPSQERWFQMRAVPLVGERRRLVVLHTDVTARRVASRALAEADRLRAQLSAQAQELGALAQMGSQDPPQYRSASPLRERLPSAFAAWAGQYGALLEEALEQRIYKTAWTPGGASGDLAAQLGRAGATPRDVIDIHLDALRLLSRGATQQRIQAYLEEGRVMALAVMGHLVTYYRSRGQ